MNKAKGEGWLVWLINNKGVEKFSNEPERYDLSQTAEVKVTNKATGKTVVVKVRPGGYELVEL